MEIITVMGGEGRAGVWLEGNNDAESHMRNFELDDAKRQLLIEDSKLSNEELQKKYRPSTSTSHLTQKTREFLNSLVILAPTSTQKSSNATYPLIDSCKLDDWIVNNGSE